MLILKRKSVVKIQVKYIICNKCGKKIYNKNHEDFLNINKNWGYYSSFDGEKHNFQLCESCYKKLIDSFKIKINSKKIIK